MSKLVEFKVQVFNRCFWVELPVRAYDFYKKLLELQGNNEYLQIKNFNQLANKTGIRWQVMDIYLDKLLEVGIIFIDTIEENGANDLGHRRIYISRELL